MKRNWNLVPCKQKDFELLNRMHLLCFGQQPNSALYYADRLSRPENYFYLVQQPQTNTNFTSTFVKVILNIMLSLVSSTPQPAKTQNFLGYIGLEVRSEELYILMLGIKSEKRGQNIGGWVLDTSIKKHLTSQHKCIALEVAENAVVAKQFYRQNNFVEVEKLQNYYGNNSAIKMVRKVNSS